MPEHNSLIYTNKQRTDHPPRPLNSFIRMPHIISESKPNCGYSPNGSRSHDNSIPFSTLLISIAITVPVSSPLPSRVCRILYPRFSRPSLHTFPTSPRNCLRTRPRPRPRRCEIESLHCLSPYYTP